MLRMLAGLEITLRCQRPAYFLWAPVFFACGIGFYFALTQEPGSGVRVLLFGGGMVVLWASLRQESGFAMVFLALGLMALGLAWSSWRAEAVSAPRLPMAYKGAIEGRVVHMDRSASGALRVTLDQVWLYELGARPQPKRVRLSLHGKASTFQAEPYQHLRFWGHLSPPAGPVEPAGFDFQRHAWFLGLGATGYTRSAVTVLETAPDRASVARLRYRLSQSIQARLPGEAGAVAAALTTGDRAALSTQTLEDLRLTNLAHLLAISGLHMGLLVSVVFSALRACMTLWPAFALRFPVKKIAAAGALIAACFYLVLSGASIATERAFVMAAVALVAILLDRRAISLRAVALAAFVVLMLRPESLLSPGFQMSFAATIALVWFYSRWQVMRLNRLPFLPRAFLAVATTSAIAGAATAPFAAAHFNQFAAYGFLANLAAVPLMGSLVMPAAVASVVLSPFGLEGVGLWAMGQGIDAILAIASFFAGLEGARLPVPAPGRWVLPMFVLGALLLLLWQGPFRFFGGLGVVIALALWAQTPRPDILIADNGAIVGVMGDEGRRLSRAKGQGFVARAWLENDGDLADQKVAFARWSGANAAAVSASPVGEGLIYLIDKNDKIQLPNCIEGDFIVADFTLMEPVKCPVFDRMSLASSGAVAVWLRPHGALIHTVSSMRGQRLWSPPAQIQ